MARRTGRKMPALLLAVVLLSCALFAVPSAASQPASVECALASGKVVNARMKSLAAGAETEFWKDTSDIKAIRMADSLPEGFVPSEANTISTPESSYPVHIFYDNTDNAGIIYVWTKAGRIVMNPDSYCLFACHNALTDISGVAGWDASYVVTLGAAFVRNFALADLTPLAAWDVHNVGDMTQIFAYDSSLVTLRGLENWNTGSLVLASAMFEYATSLRDISALAKWNTSSVTTLHALFLDASSLTSAVALKNWNTSNVTVMSSLFSGAKSLEFVDVSNWNTSKVTTMSCMFQVGENWAANGQLQEIVGLGNLDVSSVTDMTCMFYGAALMRHYDIGGWNVSRVESMNHMFCDNRLLRSLDLSRWDVSSLRTIYCMFDDNINLKTIGDVSHWNTVNLIDAGGWLNEACSFVGDYTGTLDLSGWDTRNLKSTGEMFLHTRLHTIDLSGWTFDSITNDLWEGAGEGIYYETGNSMPTMRGLGSMFKNSTNLSAVYVSRSGLESFDAAEKKGINTLDMWTRTKISGFLIK